MSDGDPFSLWDHPELLLIPVGAVLFFTVLWLAVTTILGLASGWFGLAKAYPDRPEEPIALFRGQSGLMGPGISFRGVLRLGVCPSGLRLGMLRLLGPYSNDFLVPWSDITVSRGKTLFWPVARLQFGSPRVGVLVVRARVADELAEAAGGRWPELPAPGGTS